MDDGKLGLPALLADVLLRPRRFFESLKVEEMGLRPLGVYWVVSVLAAMATGLMVARLAEQPIGAMVLIVGGGELVLAPFGWFIDVRITHAAARMLGGEGSLQATKAATGFSLMPYVFQVVPYANIPAALWAVAIKIQALRVLHRLKLGRAVLAGVSSMVALLVLPIGTAIVLRLCVVEAFKVPAGSMYPSIEIGDHLFVTKSSYGTFTKSAPTRGDVVVFEYPGRPGDQRVDYIKRVIGVPGDELTFVSGAPSINGWPVPRCRLGKATVAMGGAEPAELHEYEVFVEFLEKSSYLVAHETGRDDGRQGPYYVKPGEFWVLGDNRNNSADSRAWNMGRGGGVPFDNAKGRARWLWLPSERFGIDLAGPPVLPPGLQQLALELAQCLAAAPDLAHRTPPPASADPHLH